MAEGVTREAHRFPSLILRRFRLKSGIFAKSGQQPIRLQFKQVRLVQIHRMLEWSAGNSDIFEIKCMCRHVDFLCHRHVPRFLSYHDDSFTVPRSVRSTETSQPPIRNVSASFKPPNRKTAGPPCDRSVKTAVPSRLPVQI